MTDKQKGNILGRRAVLGGLLGISGYILARPLITAKAAETHQWLEIVQDKYNPAKWYVNLYEGPRTGDLDNGVLKSHRIEFGSITDFDQQQLAYPARIWLSSGEKEQTF